MKRLLAVLLCFMALISAGCLGEKAELSNWPDGYKSAAVLSFEVEQARGSDILNVTRVLKIHNAKGTFFVVAGYYQDAPEALDPLHGFEVASKGWRQDEWGTSYNVQRESVKEAHTWLMQQGFQPVGFRAPFLKANDETPAVLIDLGYKYDSSKAGLLPEERNGLIELPMTVSYDPFWNEEVEEYLPLLYLAFEETYDEDGLFLFYTYPEHVDDKYRGFLEHMSRKNVWFASGEEVADWWIKRKKVSLTVKGDTAVITNNGATAISGLTLKTKEGYKVLPDIAPAGTIKVKI